MKMFEQMILEALRTVVREELAKADAALALRVEELENVVRSNNAYFIDQLDTYTNNVNSKLEETVCLATVRDIVNEVISHDTPASTQIDPDALAEAVSNALDDKMDAICERVAKDIDLHGAMRDFIKNEVTISLDTY